MHTHTTAGMAVACLEEGLSYDNFMASFLPDVAYHDFQGVTVDRAEQDDLVSSLGQSNALILDKKRTYSPEQLVLDWLRREIDKRDPSYAT